MIQNKYLRPHEEEYKEFAEATLIPFLIRKNVDPEGVEECLKTFHYSKVGWARVNIKGKRYYYSDYRWKRA